MTPADIGMEAASHPEPPCAAACPQGRRRLPRFAFVAILFLVALCSAIALSGYVSDRLLALKQLEQLDETAKRLNADVDTASGRNGH